MLNSVREVRKEVDEMSKENKKKVGNMKFKKWWNKNIQEIHNRVILCYIKYRESNFNLDLKRQYYEAKREFRNQKRLNLKLRRDKNLRLINNLFKNDRNSFWKKVRRMQRQKSSVDVDMDKLKSHYENIFTKRNKNDTYNDLFHERYVKEFIYQHQNTIFDYKIESQNMKKLIESLPNNKAVGINDEVFEVMINKQITPFIFNTSIIKPLIKNVKKSSSEIENLKPIAISDCFSNLFEAVLLEELNKEHHDHPKQFGFKKNSSCQHAVWTLKQAIEFRKRMKKNTVVCSLDASKAFDKVNRTILWRQLIERNIRPYLVVGLINYYNNSYMIINNKNLFSVSFKSIVGVKQGGKCSPKLFSIYLQTLLEIISNNDTGIKINSTKIDIIAYADDVLIISSSKYSLQKALDLVNKFGEDFEILFNPLQTFYIIFNPSCSNSQPEDIQLKLSGLNIQRADSLKYLGVELNEKNDDRKHIEHRIKSSRVALAKLK
ncbi:unnamed protein product, partial [Brachionus calyciflorus]